MLGRVDLHVENIRSDPGCQNLSKDINLAWCPKPVCQKQFLSGREFDFEHQGRADNDHVIDLNMLFPI